MWMSAGEQPADEELAQLGALMEQPRGWADADQLAAKCAEIRGLRSQWDPQLHEHADTLEQRLSSMRQKLRKFKAARVSPKLVPIPELVAAVRRLETAAVETLQREAANAANESLMRSSVVTLLDTYQVVAAGASRAARQVCSSLGGQRQIEQEQIALRHLVVQQQAQMGGLAAKLDQALDQMATAEAASAAALADIAAILSSLQYESSGRQQQQEAAAAQRGIDQAQAQIQLNAVRAELDGRVKQLVSDQLQLQEQLRQHVSVKQQVGCWQ